MKDFVVIGNTVKLIKYIVKDNATGCEYPCLSDSEKEKQKLNIEALNHECTIETKDTKGKEWYETITLSSETPYAEAEKYIEMGKTEYEYQRSNTILKRIADLEEMITELTFGGDE